MWSSQQAPSKNQRSPRTVRIFQRRYCNSIRVITAIQSQLPDGAVLVVGSGQSGMQITEELYESGRTVYLCTGTAARVPRRYRGKDIVTWLADTGFFDQTVDKLPSPKARFAGNPQATGKNGGHSISLHQYARDGVKLLGHIAGAQDGKVMFAPDLKENLAKVDKAEKDIIAMIDKYIEANGIDAPQEILPDLQDGYAVEVITELDLKAAGHQRHYLGNGIHSRLQSRETAHHR